MKYENNNRKSQAGQHTQQKPNLHLIKPLKK
jgi:hypothetical protein